MPEKVFNHEVPAGLLKGWCSENEKGKSGVWYWDLQGFAEKPMFQHGHRAPFAAQNYLYVGNYGGKPLSTDIENQLACHENRLARFVQRLWKQDLSDDPQGKKLAQEALGAIFCLAVRGAWGISWKSVV